MRDLAAEEWAEVRAAVALPGWRWMPGMIGGRQGYSGLCDAVVVADVADVDPCVPDEWVYTGRLWGPEHDWREDWSDVLPNPRDPATAGCLERLLGAESVKWTPAARALAVWWPGEEGPREYAARCRGLAIIRCALERGSWGTA